MKKLIALFLAFALCFGMFAACGQKEPAPSTVAPTVPATEATEPQQTEDPGDPEGLAAALEYVKTIYKNAGGLTPKDFTRIGTVPVGTTMFEIVWTASVGEDMVKIVRGADGMVTIDVNEEASEETPYTLTATITDAAGNSVSHSWEHAIPAHLGVADILDAAYALASGESLPYEATLTGVITSIDTLWSDEYKNITVTIAMEGHEDRPVQCYRLAGDGAKDLAVGDTITVTGTLTNYKGLIEFAQGCTLDNVISGGGTPPGPKVYKYTQPLKNGQKVVIYCNSYKMALSAKKAGYYNKGVKISKDADGNYTGFTKNEVWTVIKHSNGTYSFADADGKTLGLDAEFSSMNLGAKYDDWGITKVGSGKYIIQNTKREGYFMEWYAQYNNFSTYNPNAPEKDKQFIMSFYIIDDENMPEEEPAPEVETALGIVTEPKAETAYKLGMNQAALEQLLLVTGEMSGYYGATTEEAAEAVDVYVEAVEGGYHLYMMKDEAKKYINLVPSGSYTNVKYEDAAATVYTFDAVHNTFVAVVGEGSFFMGTRDSYNTVGAYAASNLGSTNYYPIHLYEEVPLVPVVQENPVAGTAYMLGMDQAALEQLLLVTGEMSGYYLYMIKGEAKKYINLVPSGSYTNVKYEDAAATVYTFNAEHKTFVAVVGEGSFFMGTRDSYNTVGAYAASNLGSTNYYPIHLYALGAPTETPDEPEVPDVPVEPEDPEVPEIPEFVAAPEMGKAYYFAVNQAKAEKFVYFTGVKSGNFLATSENAEEAVAVYLEEAEGGFRIYFMDGETKKYVEMNEYAEGKVGVAIVTEPTTINRWDAERKAVVTTAAGADYYMGTYNTFTTISASKFSYIEDTSVVGVSQFPAAFVEAGK